MSGTRQGGKLAAQKNKKKFGKDFYKTIGAKGGKKSRTGGFFQNRALASLAGKLGGMKGSRGTTKPTLDPVKAADLKKAIKAVTGEKKD